MTDRYARIHAAIAGLADRLWEVSSDLHSRPETAFAEHHAAEVLTGELAAAGFAVTRGVAGLPTAFTGAFGRGRTPRVALLLEYDALPGLGHACGHNLIAAAGLGAALALAEALPGLDGTVLAVGAPAEEGGGGKVIEVEHGVFDGVDAALMFHPAGRTWPAPVLTAFAEVTVTMRGRAAHPTGDPEHGINALHALVRAFTAITEENERLTAGNDIHGIITHGGTATNIIPDRAEARFAVRAPTSAGLAALRETITAHAERAARAVGATAEVRAAGPVYDHFRDNPPLAGRFTAHLADAGIPADPPEPGVFLGSSDIGNVSTAVPTIHPLVAITGPEISDHTAEFAAAAASPRARAALLAAAEALARTASDVLLDPRLREDARRHFLAAQRAGR
ncbi:amidohydrolase [Bailinhaonella thermotolerans]|uniref:Peptidase M20 domain-containing protein 2 n=1 Tax=Bailinhaonella thermotolerans TaxID=1070861 RepID=A0A3A4B1A9_9ACTN|nr:amidohydrolase [Bailinhaonella thermotolerans]RJL35515.1 amidohydrolase [Bailinhaonella thermotolerans]